MQLIFLSERKRDCCRSRTADAIADRGGAFLRAGAGDVAVFDGGNFDVEVDAIEERAGDALAITLHLERTAAAFAFQIAEVAARTGIHRGHEHELGWEGYAAGCARDRDFAVFQGLPHHFERGAFELGKLVEKEDAVMREADFARRGDGGAAQQANIGNGVVR